VDPRWRFAALSPTRAFGVPLTPGILRASPEDFVVEEDLGFVASGTGQHVLLKIRKRNANTQWVARELARLCGCHPRDVGYAGLKDRRAIAVQWFTVPKSPLPVEEWLAVREPEFEVLEANAHSRKLPRGALAGNRFTIRIWKAEVADNALTERINQIRQRGVPNYFGPQRFGRDGANLERIGAGLRALRPPERGFVLSAARSLVFNAVLADRVQDKTWECLESGDSANLEGRGSIFPVGVVDPTLAERCARLDIHPTGPLWGRGVPATQHRVLELETRIATEFQQASTLTADAGMEQERRALRLAVRDLTWEREVDAIVMRFRLMRGSFATTVLREIFDCDSFLDEET